MKDDDRYFRKPSSDIEDASIRPSLVDEIEVSNSNSALGRSGINFLTVKTSGSRPAKLIVHRHFLY